MSTRRLEINRVSQFANKIRAIGIYINGEKAGEIEDGETKYFDLGSEENEIYAKIDWCKTKPIKITTAENETTSFELGSNVSGWRTLLGIYYITLGTSEYLYLKNS